MKLSSVVRWPWLLAALPSATLLAAEPGIVNVPVPIALHEIPSELCGACHQEIYKEWLGSMHAQSSALRDPIHGAFYRNLVGDPTEEGVTKKDKYPVCLKCHAPNAAIQQKTKLDAMAAYNEGVNCVFCHTITAFKGVEGADGKLRLGISAYEISPTHLQAPSGKNYGITPQPQNPTPISPVFHLFATEGRNASLHKTNDVCMGCHDRRNNFHGVPLCATGTEIADSKSFISCQACHMPTTNGHANHSMAGGHDPAMVRRAVNMVLDVTEEGGQYLARVRMKNKLPHKFPTGAPFRNAYLKLTAYNNKGQVLWQNYKTHPLKDDPRAVFFYKLGDGEGNPAMPPKAKEVLADTRLEPNTERMLEYRIPAEHVKVVRAELLYDLLLPNLVKKLDAVLTDDLKHPRLAALSEVRF